MASPPPGEEFVHDSVLGTRFRGKLLREVQVGLNLFPSSTFLLLVRESLCQQVGELEAVVPEVRGRAWVTAMSTQVPEHHRHHHQQGSPRATLHSGGGGGRPPAPRIHRGRHMVLTTSRGGVKVKVKVTVKLR